MPRLSVYFWSAEQSAMMPPSSSVRTCSSKEEICHRYVLRTSSKQLASKMSSSVASWQDKAESIKHKKSENHKILQKCSHPNCEWFLGFWSPSGHLGATEAISEHAHLCYYRHKVVVFIYIICTSVRDVQMRWTQPRNWFGQYIFWVITPETGNQESNETGETS